MRTKVQKLRNERDEARVNQTDLASHLGISRTELSLVESGRTGLTVDPDFAKRYRAALVAIAAAKRAAILQETAS